MNFTASTKTQYETHSFWNGVYKNPIQNQRLLGPGCGMLPFRTSRADPVTSSAALPEARYVQQEKAFSFKLKFN